uniref:Genome polyprotein n=1 Tax=Pteropus rufus icavirus TaxID=3044264 RepID=A0AA49FPL5_9PICO|nr:MAG: polyprotein [Pteropus rufus icavirus]
MATTTETRVEVAFSLELPFFKLNLDSSYHKKTKRNKKQTQPKEDTSVDVVDSAFVFMFQGAGSSKQSNQANESGNTGVIINNYYSNQYQQSIDLSGQSSSAGSGTASRPTNAFSDLLNTMGSVATNVAGALLMDPLTEETTNMSDRIMTESVGASALNTQATVGRMIGYRTTHNGNQPHSCSDLSTHATPGVERFYTYMAAQWTTSNSTYAYQTFTPMKVLTNDTKTLFSKNSAVHAFCKTGWRFQVQCNATQFHSGALLVACVPECVMNSSQLSDLEWRVPAATSWRTNFNRYVQNPEQWLMYPHQLLNVRTNTTVSLEVPFVNVTPTAFSELHSPWTLLIAVLSPLQYSTGASPNVEIAISVAPVKPVWNGLRQPKLNTQSPIPTQPRENSLMFLNTIPDTTTPSYGLSLNPTLSIPGEITDFRQIAMLPTFLSLPPVAAGLAKPYFSISNAVKKTPVMQINLTLNDKNLHNTALANVAKMYTQYRGTIDFSFIFTGPAMCKGKLLIAYTPPGAGTPSNVDEAMLATYATWDLGLQSTFTFTTPFISPSDFRLTAGPSASILELDGFISVFQLTAMTYPTACPPTAHVLVTASAGSDFIFKNPSGGLAMQVTDNAETGSTDKVSVAVDFDATPVPVPSLQTSLEFFFDRSFYYASIKPTNFAITALVNSNPGNGWPFKQDVLLSLTPDFSLGLDRFANSEPASSTDSNRKHRLFEPLVTQAPFTYFRSDLEVTILPISSAEQGARNNADYRVYWFPVGMTIPNNFVRDVTGTFNQPSFCLTAAPVARAKAGAMVSFSLPYTSPLSALCIAFNGYDSMGSNKKYGVCPGNSWGTILVMEETFSNIEKVKSPTYQVFIRLKKLRAFCPRPFLRSTQPSSFAALDVKASRSKVQTTEGSPRVLNLQSPSLELDHSDILLSGDVEENPGPETASFDPSEILKCFLHDHPDLTAEEKSKIVNTLKKVDKPQKAKRKTKHTDVEKEDMSAFRQFLEAEDPIETLCQGWKSIAEFQNLWKSLKSTLKSASFWFDVIVMLINFIAACTLWQSNPTAVTAICLSVFTVTNTFSFSSIKNYIVSKLQPLLSTPPPKIEENSDDGKFFKIFSRFQKSGLFSFENPDPVVSTNHYFNLFKNVEWALGLFKRLQDWVMAWFRKEEESDQSKLATLMLNFSSHVSVIEQHRLGIIRDNADESYNFMSTVYELATRTQKPAIANLASRYKEKRTIDHARVEPVVVVLRGKPGAGKSVASQILAQAISKHFVKKQSVYSLPSDCNFMDGYNRQFSVIMDDLGQNPDGKDFATFCQMVSTTHFIPNMAHLDDKGMPFTSQFVIATTNLHQFNPVTIADPQAVSRRIFLDLSVWPGAEHTCQKQLHLPSALVPTGPSPNENVFRHNCDLLHKEGLVFVDNKDSAEYSLLDVFDLVVNEIQTKEEVVSDLNKLVFQNPPESLELPPQEFVIPTSVQEELAVMRLQLQQISEFKNEILKAAGIMAIITSTAWICIKAYKAFFKQNTDKPEEVKEKTNSETLKFVTEPENQAPYDYVRKKPANLKTLTLENPPCDFENFVAVNVALPFFFYMPNEQKPRQQTCLAICDRYVAVNYHTWSEPFDEFEIRGHKYHKEQTQSLHLRYQDTDTDIVVLSLSGGGMFKNNLEKFFSVNSDIFPMRNAPVICVNSRGPLYYTGSIISPPKAVDTQAGKLESMIVYKAMTFAGYCGSAVVATTKGRKKILGFHSAGACGVAAACFTPKEHLIAAINHLKTFVHQGAKIELPPGPRTHVPRRSNLKKTLAHPIFKPKAGPAVLSKYDKRLSEGVDFDSVIFSKHTGDQTEYHQIFRETARWYAHRVFTQLGKDNGPISVEMAIKGMEFLDKMDPNTSPGLPYTLQNKKRTDLIDFELGTVTSNDLKKEFNTYLTGDYSNHVFQTFLKDEIRPLEKIEQGKTRVIDVPSLAHVLMGRCLLGRFCAKFQSLPGTELGSAIGCNPDVHWTQFAQELIGFDNVYDIDYSAFDSTHGSGIFKILVEEFFTPSNGFDPSVQPYLMSLAHSTHAWEETRFRLDGGLPSGCSATSVLNTIINNIVIRSLLSLTYSNFEPDDIVVLAYGDDLLVGTNYQLDFNAVRRTAEKYTLYKLTTASKEPEFPLTSSLLDVIFLKRRFVPYNISGFIFRPVMDTQNLKTMLSFYRPGTLEEKLLSVAELAVHSGMDIYDSLFQPFSDCGLRIPSWWTMERKWESNFMN